MTFVCPLQTNVIFRAAEHDFHLRGMAEYGIGGRADRRRGAGFAHPIFRTIQRFPACTSSAQPGTAGNGTSEEQSAST